MAELGDETLLNCREVGLLFGGAAQPLDPSTVYRWVRDGKIPPPIKLARKISRWRRSECLAVIQRMADERVQRVKEA